jgi:hypothetical protein
MCATEHACLSVLSSLVSAADTLAWFRRQILSRSAREFELSMSMLADKPR